MQVGMLSQAAASTHAVAHHADSYVDMVTCFALHPLSQLMLVSGSSYRGCLAFPAGSPHWSAGGAALCTVRLRTALPAGHWLCSHWCDMHTVLLSGPTLSCQPLCEFFGLHVCVCGGVGHLGFMVSSPSGLASWFLFPLVT